MKRQTGFTLIELVMVIVILGILGAIATPIFVDLQGDALSAAKKGMSGAAKAAHAVGIAETKGFPTLEQMVAGDGTFGPYMQSENMTYAASNAGISVEIDGSSYTIPTYTNTDCTGATSAITDQVACVGSIAP